MILIAGYGEIGQALFRVLTSAYETHVIDPGTGLNTSTTDLYEVLHVCFPWSDTFKEDVKYYMGKYKPCDTIVHSTVPVGTCRELGVLHSPVIGLHPNMVQSLYTFTKFIGGERSGDAANHLRRAGIKVYTTDKQETTELMKILSTTFYATCIEYTKEVKKKCDEFNVPFELWSLWTNVYNNGYISLGYTDYIRPNLVPMMGNIGGHCLLPNCELLESDFTELIKRRNKYGVDKRKL